VMLSNWLICASGRRSTQNCASSRWAHGAGAPEVQEFDAWETEVGADARSRSTKTRGITPWRRKAAGLRRLGLFAALPLSLVAAVCAVVVVFASHRQASSAQPAQPEAAPPSAAPSKPVAPKAAAPAIGVADAAFIAALKQQGVPVPSQDYVMTQGHAVCDFLAHQPNFADAVGFMQRRSIWDADQSTAVTAGAIVSYCPQSRPTTSDQVDPGYQKALSDLQAIEKNLQGIQGGLQDIQSGLPGISDHP